MSEVKKGNNNPLFGKTLSVETRIKISEAQKELFPKKLKL